MSKQENLVVDPSVPGQDWCVLSFVKPRDDSKELQMMMYDRFLGETINEYIISSARDMCRRINGKLQKNMDDQIQRLQKSKNENHVIIAKEMKELRHKMELDEEEFAKMCSHTHAMSPEDTKAKFQDFEIRKGGEVEAQFKEKFGAQPTVLGIKFSGAYPFQEQAQERAKFLAENIEGGVDHYVAQSFHWCPFNPNPDAVKEQKYQNQQLDKLMGERKKNQEMKDRFFQERKQELIQDAQQKNKKTKDLLKKKYKNRNRK